MKVGIRTKMFFWRFFSRTKYKQLREVEKKFVEACDSPEVQNALKDAINKIIEKLGLT